MGAGMACRDASSAVGPMVACWNIPSRQRYRETGTSFCSNFVNSDFITFSIGYTIGVFTIGVYSTYIANHWWIRAYHGYIITVAYKLSRA